MKNWIILSIAMTVSISAFAVDDEEKDTLSDKRLSNMQTQLQLSDEQLTEMRQIRDDGGTKKEIRAVLTEEQLQQLKEERNTKQSGN